MLIFRFLQIASLAYLCSIFFKMVSCHQTSAAKGQHVQRVYKLYNHCSGKHVQIVGKEVNAGGLYDSTNVNMSFMTVHTRHHPNVINIMEHNTRRFICFNKRGKLIVRFNGRKKLCLFRETFSKTHYTMFKSIYDPAWFVGFNRNGQPLKGSLYSNAKQKCFHFAKRDFDLERDDSRAPGSRKVNRLKGLEDLKDLVMDEPQGHRRRRKKVPKTPTR